MGIHFAQVISTYSVVTCSAASDGVQIPHPHSDSRKATTGNSLGRKSQVTKQVHERVAKRRQVVEVASSTLHLPPLRGSWRTGSVFLGLASQAINYRRFAAKRCGSRKSFHQNTTCCTYLREVDTRFWRIQLQLLISLVRIPSRRGAARLVVGLLGRRLLFAFF